MLANRRRVLGAAMAAGSAGLLPWNGLIAQSGSSGLLRAPKQALVIGNGRYKNAPLKNPVNDANGMAATLKAAGFAVTLAVELPQGPMHEAIRSYTESLAKTRAVGLFYFAGHGAQLAWRNYLIPVDGEITDIQDLRERGVDVNRLIEGIRRAGNPMNMIILDACRDNPFGSVARIDQKGLSQLDAPPGTLLAYATAPGNTAIDGEGSHGLYTEHLLKEIRVPEAKVEDVFKRVRLGVRRRSNGLQIPWESTSLEEDFWFIPPKELKHLAEAEIEREFKQELALWESIQSATKPEPFEQYLRRHPSGRFSELAQLRLDRALATLGEKKVEIVSSPQNPYSKGTVNADTAFRIGDTYTWRQLDSLTGLQQGKPFTRRVTGITDTEVTYGNGAHVTDLLGNRLKPGDGSTWSANQTVPNEYAVGRRWNTRFHFLNQQGGGNSTVHLDLRVATRETIVVPAGTFNAFRIDGVGWRIGEGINQLWRLKSWYAPEQVRREIAWEWSNKDRAGRYTNVSRYELTAFKQS